MKKFLTALMLLPIVVSAQVNLDSMLVGCYAFSGNAGDSSGQNNHGIVNGATLTADRFGNPNSAYLFNGTSDFISIHDFSKLNPNDEVSISMWVQTTAGGNCMFLLYPDSSNQCVGCAHYSGSNIYWDYGERTAGGSMHLTEPVSTAWHHYVFVYSLNENYKEVYRDGVSIGSEPSSLVLANKSRDLYLGAWLDAAGGNIRWKGALDDIMIHSRALSASEVSYLYAQNSICASVPSIPSGYETFTRPQIIVYPNPANDVINLGNLNKNSTVTIMNVMGEIVDSFQSVQSSEKMDVRSYSPGLYTVRIISEGRAISRQIVINH